MKQTWLWMLLVLAVFSAAISAGAVETEAPASDPVPIHTVEELLAISEDPYGSYILMEDLDLAGMEWKSMDFYGVFNGNGHAILNLTITQPGDEICDAYDGNLRNYPSHYFGFFGMLRDAEVKDLTLVNVRALVEWDGPVFLGALAGRGENAVITGCSVTGILELRAHDRCFGLGGLVGYGVGRMENCGVDVTLICVDTDDTTRDEQFLGGLFASGYFHVYSCNVQLDGYISECGYVHSGGVTGMHSWYPWEDGAVGYIVDTHVSGKITFFENNSKRRAYCEALVGEPLPGWIDKKGSTSDFVRDERFAYDRELRPEMCEQPVYTETIVPADCAQFGYTCYTCTECGYTYTDNYTLRVHAVSDWVLVQEPTTEEEGVSIGYCGCGMEHTRTEPKLPPEPTEMTEVTESTEAPETAPSAAPTEQSGQTSEQKAFSLDFSTGVMLGVVILLLTLALILLVILLRILRRGK